MLDFRPLEKNLFGQVPSWSAASGDGRYVVERSPTQEAFQARYQPASGKPIPLQGGAWLPRFERARQLCESDAQARLRQRIIAKGRRH